jgi:hypothetical protein
MSKYYKGIAALIGAVGTWGVSVTADNGNITTSEWFGLLVALAAAAGVVAAPKNTE